MRRTALVKPTWLGRSAGRTSPAAPSQEHRAARWQWALGNRGVERLLRPQLQPKLTVGAAAAPFEREADRVADHVLRTPRADHAMPPASGPRSQRLCAEGGDEPRARPEHEEEIAPKAQPGKAPAVPPELAGPSRAVGNGRPLPGPTRAFFEPRFGCALGGVRVHTGGAAAATARRHRARALTSGRDIVFGAGEYAPATMAGRSLLAHELAHVVQQAPGRAAPQASMAQAEREADAAAALRGRVPLSARPIAVHRQPAPAKSGMTRADFANRLKAIFGHEVPIVVGDKERQAKELRGPPAMRQLPDWKAWDPGASSPLYDEILGAILDFGREVGGVPDIGEIVFYEVRYAYDDQLKVVADTNAAAQISSRRVLFVYRAALFETPQIAGASTFSRSGVLLASKRSTAGKKGVSAPMDAPTHAESQRRVIAHELGHGVEFATRSLSEFEQAVGWVRVDGEPRLYDIQASGVKAAIAKGAEPPAAARITKADWNSGAHLEQPMREYAVSHPAEDFADSLMAWLYARDVLKARSPARFKFFDDQARRKGWLPKLATGGAPPASTRSTP